MSVEHVDAGALAVEAIELCYRRGWTDGLPVVPPLRALVERMAAGVDLPPDELVCRVPPRWGRATVERIAANAVMAGCRPEYMPVIVAALRALADDRFNLHGVQCTTHVATPLLIVNGSLARQLEINAGHNCLGQGWRANATIGRAVRLVLTNLGGALPGGMDKATFGHPGKYTYCLAENEAESPWEPLHVERGLLESASAVTVFAAEAPHNVNNHPADNPFDLLDTVADTMATLGNNNIYLMSESLVVLGPEHARSIAGAGWTKRHVKEYLYERARRRVRELAIGGLYGADLERNLWPRWIRRDDPDALVPIARRPEDIVVIVAGGAGRHSLVIPGWGTRTVTRPIEHVPAMPGSSTDVGAASPSQP